MSGVHWAYPGLRPASGLTADAFKATLKRVGVWYNNKTNTLASDYTLLYLVSDVPNVEKVVGGQTVGAVTQALPYVPVTVTSANLVIAAPQPPTGGPGGWTYGETNPSQATLTYTRTTGIVQGNFNVYYDSVDAGVWSHINVPVSYQAVITDDGSGCCGDPDPLPAAQGFYLVPDQWVSGDGKTNKFNRSYAIWLTL